MNNKVDRRTKYTKRIIKDSLLQTMKTKPLSKITVTEICKLADINRGTFYSHFEDIFDVINRLENNLYNKISEKVDDILINDSFANIKALLDVLYSEKKLCLILFNKHSESTFLEKFFVGTRSKLFAQMRKGDINIEASIYEYWFAFITNGSISIVKEWIAKGMKESTTFIANLVMKLSSYSGLDRLK